MARQIEDLIVRLKKEGFENLDKIKSSFRELGKVTGFTEVEIARLRKEVLNFDKGVDKSTQTLRGQTDALKALQSQAATNSTIYRQLGSDLKNLGNAYKEAATGVKQFSDAQLRTQKPGAKVSTFGPQIQTLKRDLAELSVYSTKYAELLTTIKRRELPFNLATGRQNVIAAAEAYRLGPELANAATNMPGMPRTNAALAQSIQEVTDRFANLVRGTREWREAANELKRLSRESAEGFNYLSAGAAAAKTRLDALRTSAGGFAEFSRNPLQLTQLAADQAAIQKSIERNRRKRGLLGAQVSDTPFGPAEPTELFRNIAGVQSQQVTNQLLGRSYTDVAASIRQVSASSDGSLNSLRAQRTAWESLRNALGDNKVALREVDKELGQLDRRIEKRSLGRGKLTGMQLAQGVGAALSGGIFGGPEGLIGGLGGLAVGGVGGAFAGAAFGAQVGMLRKSIFDAGEYAATVDRLNIALKGVVKTTADYTAAQQTIKLAQVQLNVPVLEGTQSFTRLAASVIAAGGNVSDTSTVFRGVSEAIKATGGGAEETQAAILAMSQIFSKGKVSAEELQGQLGERLPGAVATFAAATNRTLPQLQKDLQDGTVGLNDVMKFVSKLSETYGTQAATMAASSADATARMQASIKDLQYAFGSVVKPISSSVQDIIAKMADMANATLKAVGIVKNGLGELGAVSRGQDLSRRAGYAYTALGIGSQSYEEKRRALSLAEQLANAATPQRSTEGIKQNITALQQAREVVRRITAENLTDKQTNQLLRYGTALDKRVEAEKELLKTVQSRITVTNFNTPKSTATTDEQTKGEKAARDAQAAAAEQQRLANTLLDQQLRAADTVFKHQIELDRQRYELQKSLDDAQAQNRILRETGTGRDIVSNFQDLQRSLRDIEERRLTATQNVRLARQTQQSAAVRATFAEQGAAALSSGATGFISKEQLRAWLIKQGFGRTTGDFTNRGHNTPNHMLNAMDMGILGGSDANALRLTAAMERRLAATGAFGTQLFGPTRDPYGHGAGKGGQNIHLHIPTPGGKVPLTPGLAALMGMGGTVKLPTGAAAQRNRAIQTGGGAAIEALDVAQAQAQQQLIEASTAKERAVLFEQFTLKATDALRQQNQTVRDSNELQTLHNRLTLEGVSPGRIDLEERLLGIRQEQSKAQNAYTQLIVENPTREAELTAALTAQNEQFAERARLLREGADAAETFNRAMRTRQDDRIGLGLREGAEQYVRSIGTMREATAQLAQTGIKGVEDAIFNLVTTGTANFREFAASMLKDTARMIIQQLILRNVMQIIGAIGGGGGSAVDPLARFNAGAAQYMPNALGNAYAANGIVPFAMGGIVTKPTLFKFANGGVPATGLMGEAGPEAIMPLRRLPGGRLGVEAAGGKSMSIVVNVDAGNSDVQGDSEQASRLGKLLSAAVQAELIKQQRRGGLLNQAR